MDNFEKFENVPTGALKETTVNNINDDITGNTDSFNSAINDNPAQGHPEDFGKYNGQQQPGNKPFAQPGQTLSAGNLITGDMAVHFMDILIPTLAVLVFKKALDRTVSKRSFALTNTEKDTIKPVLQNYLNSINFTVENPFNALLLTVGMIYGMKIVEVMNEVPNGNFKPGSPGAANVGQTTAAGTIKTDGRGRPKGSTNKKR